MDLIVAPFSVGISALASGIGLLGLALPLLWLWMLIDAVLREEWEYPGATPTSNNKLLWVLLIVLVQVSAAVYFFMVFTKVKRGSLARPEWAAPRAA